MVLAHPLLCFFVVDAFENHRRIQKVQFTKRARATSSIDSWNMASE